MAQFTCRVCGDNFDQKSRFERHMATSHPESAPSAADIEKTLSGIQYPKSREELVDYASGRVSDDEELINLIRSLPSRRYRDAAEVAIALGEVKQRQGVRSSPRQKPQVQRVEGLLQPCQFLLPQLPRFFQE